MHRRPLFLREKNKILAVASQAENAKLMVTRQELTGWSEQPQSFQAPKNSGGATNIPPADIFREIETNCPTEISSHARAVIMMVLLSFMSQSGCYRPINQIRTPENPEQEVATVNPKIQQTANPVLENPRSKIAVIINGDTEGHDQKREEGKTGPKQHIKNVELAMGALKTRGFDSFYVVSSQKIEKKGIKLSQYKGSMDGLDKMFDELKAKGVLRKDTLVFFYTTGHAEKSKDGSCLVMEDGCYENDRLIERLQLIKKNGSRILFVADQCLSGSLPDSIIKSGVEGIAMSPGAEGKLTHCEHFAPFLFELIKTNYDSNKDGISEPSEWFKAAMANYKNITGKKENGKYKESRNELNLGNLENIIRTKKTLIILINTTWCGACKEQGRTFDEIKGILGEQVDIVNLTTDTNPAEKQILQKLGIGDVTSFPTILIRQKDGKFRTFVGAKNTTQVLDELKKIGIKTDPKIIEDVLVRTTGKSHEIVQRFTKVGITDPDFIKAGDDIQSAAKNSLKGNSPWDVMSHKKELEKLLPDYDDLFKKSYEATMAKDPVVIFYFSDILKDKPWAQEGLKLAREKLFKESPWYIFMYADHFKKILPDYEQILEKTTKATVMMKPEMAIIYSNIYIDKPWAKEVLYYFVIKFPHLTPKILPFFKEIKDYPKILENVITRKLNAEGVLDNIDSFINEPWAEMTIKWAASKKPEMALNHADKFIKKPWAEAIIKKISVNNEMSVLSNSDKLKIQPWAREVIMKVAKSVPYFALLSSDKFADASWAEEVIRMIAKRKIVETFENIHQFISQPWSEDFIKEMADKYPAYGLIFSYKYKNQQYYPELSQKCLSRTDKKQIFNLTGKSAYLCPIIKSYDIYKNQPWAKELVNKAAINIGIKCDRDISFKSEDVNCIFENYELFKGQPWLKDVIKKISQTNYRAVLKHTDKFKDEPWAEEIITKAKKDVEKDNRDNERLQNLLMQNR